MNPAPSCTPLTGLTRLTGAMALQKRALDGLAMPVLWMQRRCARMQDSRPDYGIDAPNVLRNLFLIGVPLLLWGIFGPKEIQLGLVTLLLRPMFFWTGVFLIVEGL